MNTRANKDTKNLASAKLYGHHQTEVGSDDPVEHQQPETPKLAPLASLDCSISEPISMTSQSISIFNTPTLTEYFDCDHLSDMIDDSIFDITNFGCISKSTLESYRHHNQSDFGASKISQLGDSSAFNPSSSSTFQSKEPRSIANTLSFNNSLDSKGWIRSFTSESNGSNSSLVSLQKSDMNNLDQNSNWSSEPMGEQKNTKISKSRSELEMQNQYHQELSSQDESPNQSVSYDDISKLKDSDKKKRRGVKRLTLDLLSYFFPSYKSNPINTNGHSSHDRQSNERSDGFGTEIKSIKKTTANPIENQPSKYQKSQQRKQEAKKSRQQNLRDSIKVTNQRRQKSQAKSKNLDVASRAQVESGKRLSRDSTGSTHSGARKVSKTTTDSSLLRSSQQRTSSRPVKSVKFTIPDLQSDQPNSKRSASSSALASQPQPFVSKKNQPHLATEANPKGSVSSSSESARGSKKSTSSCQTDLDKNLEDLLARYDKNYELIAEINEKLKLNETIASPKSILDSQAQNSSILINHDNDNIYTEASS